MIGAVLAGGAGRRLGIADGGGKAGVELAGRALVEYPLAVLAGICERVAIVCKPATRLPALGGAAGTVERWDEPVEPRHPLTGIVHALERAGAPVLICAADMPLVTAEACHSLIAVAARGGAAATVAVRCGQLQPVLGVYAQQALEPLRHAPADVPLTAVVAALDPVRVALPAAVTRNVNTPEDLTAAAAALRAS